VSLRNRLIVGLADIDAGSRVHDVVQHISGTTNALTVTPPTVVVGATTVTVGASTSSIGFFGAAATVKPTGITAGTTGLTLLQQSLANLGLITVV